MKPVKYLDITWSVSEKYQEWYTEYNGKKYLTRQTYHNDDNQIWGLFEENSKDEIRIGTNYGAYDESKREHEWMYIYRFEFEGKYRAQIFVLEQMSNWLHAKEKLKYLESLK
jgi:hypothetical protein